MEAVEAGKKVGKKLARGRRSTSEVERSSSSSRCSERKTDEGTAGRALLLSTAQQQAAIESARARSRWKETTTREGSDDKD